MDRSTLCVESYSSTRSSCNVTFETAITSGYAADGGLFVPSGPLPYFTMERLGEMIKYEFDELAFAILRRFLPAKEIDDDKLRAVIERAYSKFTSKDRVEVVKPGSSPVTIAELFHGPTFCFKDLGLSMLCNLISHFTPPEVEKKRTLVVSTTGDTGPAALASVDRAANPNLNILAFFPSGGQISAFQRLQMTSLMSSPNIEVVEFCGGGDDMDKPIKMMQKDKDWMAEAGLCGVNSYNIGRPLAQMVHYFWSVFRILEAIYGKENCLDQSKRVNVVIPTGAMGNIVACYMSKLCGLPINCITAGVNANDITHRAFQNGDFSKSEAMEKTLSDAINIQVPYNMERLLFYASGGDSARIKGWYDKMDETDSLQLDPEFVSTLQSEFSSVRVDDDEMCAMVRQFKADHDYLADPHTAVALAAAEKMGYFQLSEVPTLVMATASPCKFEKSITIAAGEKEWEAFFNGESFPKTGKELLERAKAGGMDEPEIWKAEEEGLDKTQAAWELKARGLIKEKFLM